MGNWRRFISVVLLSWSLVLGTGFYANAQTNPALLVRQAQQQYEEGKSSQALTLLERAATIYQNRAEILPQIQILTLTSLVQQQQRNWEPAQRNLERASSLIEPLTVSANKIQVLAQICHARGHYFLGMGKPAKALQDWEQAKQLYRQIKDETGIAGTTLDEAEALGKMGFHRRACDRVLTSLNSKEYRCQNLTLEDTAAIIDRAQINNQSWLVDSLISISNSLLSMGKLLPAKEFAIASQSRLSTSRTKLKTQAKVYLSLGNIEREIALQAKAQADSERFKLHSNWAIEHFQRIEPLFSTSYSNEKLAARLNKLSLFIASRQRGKATNLANQIELAPDRADLYASLQFANSLRRLQSERSLKYKTKDIADIYLDVAQQAQRSADSRLESYAWGNLGELQAAKVISISLEDSSQTLLERALLLAQSSQAPEIAYRWQWRLGRIYRQGKEPDKRRSLVIGQPWLI